MPPGGMEPIIPASETHSLNRAATGIGRVRIRRDWLRAVVRSNPVTRGWKCHWMDTINRTRVIAVTGQEYGLDKIRALESAHFARICNKIPSWDSSSVHMFTMSRTVTRVGAGRLAKFMTIPGRGGNVHTSLKCPDTFWVYSPLHSLCIACSFPKRKSTGAWNWPLTSTFCRG